MQSIAREMNLSETAFLVPRDDGYDLRWFTPAVEVDLCGHATLASAHTLWETGVLPPGQQARFHTRSGLLTCTLAAGQIEMDFPATPPRPVDPPPGLANALGIEPRWVGQNRFDFLVEVPEESDVRGVAPDFRALKALGVRGVMVTAKADLEGSIRPGLPTAAEPFDFVSRFFAPGAGIDEDPVTGSAHCTLGPYWGRRLAKDELLAFQASVRGGVVRVRLAGDRVILGGQAVTVLKGEILDWPGTPG
jgi:PhzF family phenazine biosynthesis protein